jgi:hypothetical protein
MADSKITALDNLTAADPVNDMFPIVDVSDTTMAASGTTKRISVNNILGASGTATLASATITGALTVDTSTLKVDSTNNRVGIGTATPAVICDVTAIEADIAIFRSTGGGGNDKRLTITSGGDRVILNVSNNTNTATAQAYVFQSAGTEVGRINTTGVYVLAGGTTTANGVGVAFPSTQSASSDANCLDDYEEGTFLPIVQGSTTAGVGVYSTQDGRYTKVGRLVTAEIYIVWTAHTGTGDLRIGGLPFTANASFYSAATIGLASNIALSASNTISAINQINATYINIVQSPVGGGAFSNVPMDVAATMILSITYSV